MDIDKAVKGLVTQYLLSSTYRYVVALDLIEESQL